MHKANSFDTVLPADSLEFCPTSGFHNLFVCGTYKLLDQIEQDVETVEGRSTVPQTRRGQCLVFRIQEGLSSAIPVLCVLKEDVFLS